MKKNLLPVVALVMVISASEAMEQYNTYTGTKPGLMVRLEYPKDWMLHEEHGKIDAYRQIRLLGPRNSDDTYTPYLSVRGSPRKPFGGRHETLEDLVNHYRNHLIQGTQIVSEKATGVADKRGIDLTVSYTLPALHHKGLKGVEVAVRSRTVFLEGESHLYELIFSSDEREYDRHVEAFEHLLQTFRFQ